jgi:hypothetical protein
MEPSIELESERRALFMCATCTSICAKMRRCQRCKVVTYCTRECQRKDWPNHKPQCVEAKESSIDASLKHFTVVRILPTLERLKPTESEMALAKKALNSGARHCASYSFVARGEMILDSELLSESMGFPCRVGDMQYHNPVMHIETSVMVGRWFFCIEVNTSLPNGKHCIGGFLSDAHYLFCELLPLRKGATWPHLLFDWVVKEVIHVLQPSRTPLVTMRGDDEEQVNVSHHLNVEFLQEPVLYEYRNPLADDAFAMMMKK